MSACSFDRLLKFVNKQLDLDGQLEVYDHLDRCDICRDAVYQLSRDRDEALFIYRARRVKPSVFQHPIDAAVGSPGAYR
jgi:Fe-S oxidoreductase